MDVGIGGGKELDKHRDGASVDELLPVIVWKDKSDMAFIVCARHGIPEWVMFSRAPVAFRCTRISFDLAKRVRGAKAPDLAIFALLSS